MPVIGMNQAALCYLKTDPNPVSEKSFRQIAAGFSKFLVGKLIDGETVRLPEKLGELRIGGTKMKPTIDPETGYIKGLSPDWPATKELWKKCSSCEQEKQLIFYLNEETNGIRYSIRWGKKGIFISNKDFYSFVAVRSFKALLKEAIRSKKEYFITANNSK